MLGTTGTMSTMHTMTPSKIVQKAVGHSVSSLILKPPILPGKDQLAKSAGASTLMQGGGLEPNPYTYQDKFAGVCK